MIERLIRGVFILIVMALKKFIALGENHWNFQDIEKVVNRIGRLSPDVITIERCLGINSNSHEVLMYGEDLADDISGFTLSAGVIYALRNKIPLYFVDGTYSEGPFQMQNPDLASSLNLTELRLEEFGDRKKLRYGEVFLPDREEEFLSLNEEALSRYLAERNRFSADAINRIARERDISILLHIGGIEIGRAHV